MCLLGVVLKHITSLPLLEGIRKLWCKSTDTFSASVKFYKAFVYFNIAINQWKFIPYLKFVYCISGLSDVLETLKLSAESWLGFLMHEHFSNQPYSRLLDLWGFRPLWLKVDKENIFISCLSLFISCMKQDTVVLVYFFQRW